MHVPARTAELTVGVAVHVAVTMLVTASIAFAIVSTVSTVSTAMTTFVSVTVILRQIRFSNIVWLRLESEISLSFFPCPLVHKGWNWHFCHLTWMCTHVAEINVMYLQVKTWNLLFI
jgi:hypothetical protein